MNYWTKLSIEYANQRSYLDDLFQVYPTVPDGIRDINKAIWEEVEKAFTNRDDLLLLENVLKLKLFPIKDSYVAYLRRDHSALKRNPATVARLCGRLYEMGIERMYSQSSEPKEMNRRMGPLFKLWLKKKSLGIDPVKLDEFLKTSENAILDASDSEMMSFARQNLNYKRKKGLDFVARFNKKYVIGEAKFLTEFGGHQTTQFNDAIALVKSRGLSAIPIAILDGVVYVKGRNKMFNALRGSLRNKNIMSALVLRDFLYQI